MMYKGCKLLDKKKGKELGWTYSELQKLWRMANRENQINKWKKVKFKQWRDNLVTIS